MLAAITVGLSLALIALGVGLHEGFWKTLLLTVATATLAIGGITLVYETYLRRTLIQDVLAIVQLEERLADSGIQEISKRPGVDWSAFFENAEHVRLLPVDPSSWLVEEWVYLAETRLHQGAAVEVYLPNPAGAATAEIAIRLGRTPDSFESDLHRVLQKVEHDCKSLHSQGRAKSLSISTYEGTPGYGLAIADARVIVSVPGLLDVPGSAETVAFRFGKGNDRIMERWVRSQLDGLPDTGTYFTT